MPIVGIYKGLFKCLDTIKERTKYETSRKHIITQNIPLYMLRKSRNDMIYLDMN